jgi:manganese efflux pump family protein
MTPGAIVLLSLSMSTDAFAAAVGRGASRRPTMSAAVRTGAVFGIVEAITPLIGWGLGVLAASFIQQIDHWIAFALLGAVGGRMIYLSQQMEVEHHTPARSGAFVLIATAIGTSIDAAAVGVGLAFIGANIWVIAASIGLTTFLLTSMGMMIGGSVGARAGKKAELLGGLMLIGLGFTILFEHLA